MTGSTRVIWELVLGAGINPEQVDTDEQATVAPVYEDIVAAPVQWKTLPTSAVDSPVVIEAGCAFLLVSDVEIGVRLADGETLMRVRHLYMGAGDSSGEAIPATSILLTGNADSTATVSIRTFGTVT